MLVDKIPPLRYIFGNIKYEMLSVLVVGVIIHYAAEILAVHLPEMPLTIPAFIGTAISVLLSFRMSQSYDRWWEARKIWGAIVNDSRSFVLQLQAFIKNPELEPQIKTMAYRQIAWNYVLGRSLRGQPSLEGCEKLLSHTDIENLKKHNNKVLGILQQNVLQVSELHKQGVISDFTHVQFNNIFIRFSDNMGMAERIKNTVFPTTYRIFLHFAIYLFVITLSIALNNVKILFELPLLLLISMVFFLLEKAADDLQDPFSNRPSDTNVTTIARNIEINIRQLLGEEDVPQPIEKDSFYSL
ncbi:bestrophin family protein [Flavobacterium sp. RHBU_3]|uniref:bestrophin family protein n=1 Tax=Flavobacterium sp. RHBU_3 TaxID=3391184 RepID=UPI0039849719